VVDVCGWLSLVAAVAVSVAVTRTTLSGGRWTGLTVVPDRAPPGLQMAPFSVVGVFRVSGRGVDDPDRVVGVVDDIAHAATAGDFVFPLFELVAVVLVGGEISTQAMLSIMVYAGTWLGS